MSGTLIRFGNGERRRFDASPERLDVLRAMARDLTRAKVDSTRIVNILRDAAKASDGELRALLALVAELAAGVTGPKPAACAPAAAAETVAQYADLNPTEALGGTPS